MWPLFPQSTPAIRPSLTLFFYLVGAFLLALLPHVQQLPLWITVTILVAMGFRSLIELYRWRLPSPAFCAVVALCFFSAVYLQFHTVLGRDAGTALMALLLAVKFYELRSPRDTALIIFCCFFVVISSLLYSQALELFVYCLIMMWVLTALLLRTSMGDLSTNRADSPPASLRLDPSPSRASRAFSLLFLSSFSRLSPAQYGRLVHWPHRCPATRQHLAAFRG